jgi:hypothetical protein
VNGEVEHGGACIHPTIGRPVRAAIGGGEAVIPSNVKVAAAGTALDLPLGHKDDPWSFAHFDTMTVMVADAPRPGRDRGGAGPRRRRPAQQPLRRGTGALGRRVRHGEVPAPRGARGRPRRHGAGQPFDAWAVARHPGLAAHPAREHGKVEVGQEKRAPSTRGAGAASRSMTRQIPRAISRARSRMAGACAGSALKRSG